MAMFMALFLAACSATGPVRFYQGPPKPQDQLAIVIVPAALNVLSIDGEPVDSPSQETGTYQLELLPGHHLIAFRYELYWGTNVSGKLVKSKEVAVDAIFNAGSIYRMHFKEPQTIDEAYDFYSHFSATLTNDQSGQSFASYEIENLGAVLAAKGIAKGQSPAAQRTVVAKPGSTVTTNPADKVVNQDPVKRLKFWWLMANEQQRKQFTEWMKGAGESFAPTDKNTPDHSPPGTINGVDLKP